MTAERFDTANRFLVGVQGARLLVARPPLRFLTAAEALNLAAWLVAMAEVVQEQDEPPFEELLAAVRGA